MKLCTVCGDGCHPRRANQEGAVGRAFEHVAVSARLKVDTVADATRPDPESGDVLALARINRERDQAALRFARDRDLGRLEATMARLDAEAPAAVVRSSRMPTAAEALAYLAELPKLWAKTSDAGRHAIAEAAFGRSRLRLEWSVWSGREESGRWFPRLGSSFRSGWPRLSHRDQARSRSQGWTSATRLMA